MRNPQVKKVNCAALHRVKACSAEPRAPCALHPAGLEAAAPPRPLDWDCSAPDWLGGLPLRCGRPGTGAACALAAVQAYIESAALAVVGLGRELKRARAAAAAGEVRELRRSLRVAADQAREVADRVSAAEACYEVDEVELLESGAYAKELRAAAEAAGVAMFERDDQLLCYPSIVRVLPGERALEVDRRRLRGIRPSVVVDQLGRAQRAGPRFRPGPFLASLASAYELVRARQSVGAGAVVRLVDIYAVLTLLPGQTRDYSRAEFARDLYLLDQSGEHTATDGRRLRWAASSGTRTAGVLTTVARSGVQQRYWGIAFEPAP
jgi:hypothetical protein